MRFLGLSLLTHGLLIWSYPRAWFPSIGSPMVGIGPVWVAVEKVKQERPTRGIKRGQVQALRPGHKKSHSVGMDSAQPSPSEPQSLGWTKRTLMGFGNPAPRYPEWAIRHELEGEVEIVLHFEGREVVDVEVVRSSGHTILDESVLRTVRAWKLPFEGMSKEARMSFAFQLERP